MNNKIAIWIFFGIIVILQFYVPANMIFEQESIIKYGEEFKFITQPLDPNDPFRGKFIALDFSANNFRIADTNLTFEYDEIIYVKIDRDENGFAKITDVLKSEPTNDEIFIKAKVSSFNSDRMLYIVYPFNRFYMEESKAYPAELTINRTNRDSLESAYAIVSVKNGSAVLKDIMIGDNSIKDIIKQSQEKQKD